MPGVAEAVFLDTNLWLYALIKQDADKQKIAKVLIQQHRIVASSQVINEICVNLLKRGLMNETQIRQLIESFYRDHRVVMLDSTCLDTASQLRERYRFSFWDSLIVSSALNADCITLYSEDMHHSLLVDNSLRIVNPFIQ